MILNNYFRNKRTIKSKCYICKPDFHILIRNYARFFPEYVIESVEQTKFEDYFYGVYKVEESDSENELGVFHVLQNSNELYLMTSDSADFFEKTLNRIFKLISSEMIPVYIHSNEIFEILNNFEKIKKVDLFVKRVVNKRIFGLSPRTGIVFETYKEGRIYPNFKEAFAFAKENDMWIDRIKISGYQTNPNQEFEFSLSRKGEISINHGFIETYFTNVLSQIMEYGKERLEQFRGRSRRDQPDKKPKPLLVKFGKNVFESMDNRRDFIDILEKYPNCNYSVVHNGNPHVYLSVLDRMDNSSFSVRTLGNDDLLLVPQIKTSPVALMRFSEFLITSFHEGVIQNYVRKEN